MTSSKILFFLCISFIAGIFLESLVKIPQIFLWAFLFVIMFIILFFFILSLRASGASAAIQSYRLPRRPYRIFDLRAPRNDEILVAGFCLLFLVLGILRVQITEFNIVNDKLSKLNGKGGVVLTGTISSEPDVRETFQKLKVKIGSSIVLATVKKYPEYKYLDKIKLTGKLETPIVTDEFNYKNYLMKDGIYSVMNFPKIEKTGHNNCSFYRCPASVIYAGILEIKQKIRQSIQSNFSPPESSILEGTILGDNGAMSNDLKTKLNITGLRHIIAVSGTHVVILSLILMSVLLFLGFHKGHAFYFSIFFICIYIILTGLPASGIRAGIMGGIILLAEKIGRQSVAVRVITLAAAVMLALNPFLLIYDVGFQLSFSAVLGLIYLEPLIKIFLKFIPENLRRIFSATFAAQIFTLPILVFNFGNISFVSPITNLLVSAIVSPLMILGFLASFLGIFSNILGYILSVPCYFLLLYFNWIINFFAKPWAMAVFPNVSSIWLFISYFIIAFLTWFLNKKYKQNFV